VTKLLLLAGASARIQLRWAREHLYAWLVLAPLILGMSYLSVTQLAENVQFRQPSPGIAQVIAAASLLCLIALSLSRAGIELYHIGQPESTFEAFPLTASQHFHFALFGRVIRTLVLATFSLLLIWWHSKQAPPSWQKLGSIILLVILIAVTEVFGAMNWIHWGHTRNRLTAACAGFTIVAVAFAGGLLLLVGLGSSSESRSWPVAVCAALASSGYLLTHRLHQSWRTHDIEYARRLQASGGWSFIPERILRQRLGRIVSAQVVRDLQLTVRRFSSAVYVVLALAGLSILAVLSAVLTDSLPYVSVEPGWLNLTWRAPIVAIKVASLLATVSLAGLVPVIVFHQLPHFWLERAVGAVGLDMWTAKLWYARLISLFAPMVAWAAGMLTGRVPLSYSIPLLAECVWLWWLASSLIGSLAFEMPARPALSLIVMSTIGLAAGVVAALLWPAGLLIYVFSMHALTDRGRARARYYILTEDD
jgi:hypothetical protein